MPSRTVAGLFPAGVAAAELHGSGDPALLAPEEFDCVKEARLKRQQEFAAGRLCARRAMAELGVPEVPLRALLDRSPAWPEPLIGSITHTDGYCAAVVAWRHTAASLGLDAEVVARVNPDLWARICTRSELDALTHLDAAAAQRAAALIFAAKEAFYKCQFALTREWLDFDDVVIRSPDWSKTGGAFSVHALRRTRLEEFSPQPVVGRFAFADRLVIAGACLPAIP